MSNKSKYCPNCGNPIGPDRIRCPECGGATVVFMEIHSKGKAPGLHPPGKPIVPILIVAAILMLLASAVFFKWVFPRMKVPVQVVEDTICEETGWLVSSENVTVKVRRMDLDSYDKRIEKKIFCDEEKLSTLEKLAAKVGKIAAPLKKRLAERLEEVTGMIEDKFYTARPTSEQGYGAEIIPHEAVHADMKPKQVSAAWGEPVDVNYAFAKNEQVEHWQFGDPLYGIFILDRYVEFQDGRVSEFKIDRAIEKLYLEVIKEQQEERRRRHQR